MQMRSGKVQEREAAEREKGLLERVKSHLEADTPLRTAITDPQDEQALSNYGLLSLKPMLIVLNISESAVSDQEKVATEGRQKHDARGTKTTAVCAKLEAELAELPEDEAAEFRKEMGAPEGGTHRVLEQARELLGLVTFFTAGEQDTHAWTVPEGASALVAAGRIHSDIARGFIRAEVISWDKLLEHKTHAEARKHAALRQEGKSYVVQEGDVINVLFNV
jgi:ribosome-binding ATPase YchF (GTP1/OBG family)